jgi:hypothetical protein
MHSKKMVPGTDALPAKNILTRRANQGHDYIIALFIRRPCNRLPGAIEGKKSLPQLKLHRLARGECSPARCQIARVSDARA